jgi:hypothetical protein
MLNNDLQQVDFLVLIVLRDKQIFFEMLEYEPRLLHEDSWFFSVAKNKISKII